jgi:phosphohistidine swiveling domain-containing protein
LDQTVHVYGRGGFNVAREHAIPVGMGTGNAPERIPEGLVVTVDGTDRKVYLW